MAWSDNDSALQLLPAHETQAATAEAVLTVDEAAPRRRSRRLLACIALAACVLLGAMSVPMIAGRVYVADDLGEFHLPARAFYAQQLARHESFDWWPDLYCGFYLSGEGQLGGYHPWHWFLYRCLPLGMALDVEVLANYPLMLLGMFFFLRRLVVRRDAALFGACLFTFSGFTMLHFMHTNAIAVVAHLPWLLWAIDVAVRSPNRRRAAWAEVAIALLTGSQLLLGYPQYVWFSLLAELSFAAWRLWPLRSRGWIIARLLFAVSCGLLIGAIQLLPTYDLLTESTRRQPDAAFANNGSLHPLNLVQLVAPYLFATRVVGQNTHELGLYAGAVPLVLCVWLLTNRRYWGRYRPLVLATIAFGVVSLLLAFGEYGGIYAIQNYLPLANRFRFPCRAIVLVNLAIASAAAFAFAILIRIGSTKPDLNRRHFAPLRWIAIASVLAAGVVSMWLPREFLASACKVWSGPLLVSVAAWLVCEAWSGRRWAPAALVVFALVDLGIYGLSYAVLPKTATLKEFIADAPRPPAPVGSRVVLDHHEAGKQGERFGNRVVLAGYPRADGYAGLEPARQLDFNKPATLRTAGVAWILSGWIKKDHWFPIDNPAPRARLINGQSDAAAVGDGAVMVVIDRPGHIEVTTNTAKRGTLALTESFHHGWRATLDGHDVPVVRVNGDFLGCSIEPGKHQVVLRFEPSSLKYGAMVSLGGLSLMVGMFLIRYRGTRS